MSQCKNWWNDDWRDRMLAFMEWLTEGQDNLYIPLGGESLGISARPFTVSSPVTYEQPSKEVNSDQLSLEESDGDEVEAGDDDFFGDEEDE
jgi:hypothetical protein